VIDRIANRILVALRQDIPQTDEEWDAAMATYRRWCEEIDRGELIP
jgi:hypothetical protein